MTGRRKTASTRCRVFVSYRRSTNPSLALLLRSVLDERLGAGSVFVDEQSIPAGEQFRWVIEAAAGTCKAMVVLIGPGWAPKRLDARRVFGHIDYVLREVSIALQRQIHILPVLLDGARMPSRKDLPAELGALTSYQALAVRTDQPALAVQKIIDVLEPWLESAADDDFSYQPGGDDEDLALADATADGLNSPDELLQAWKDARGAGEAEPKKWIRLADRLADHGFTSEAEDSYHHALVTASGPAEALARCGLCRISTERGEYRIAGDHLVRGLAAIDANETGGRVAGADDEIEVITGDSEDLDAAENMARADGLGAFARCPSDSHAEALSSLYGEMGALARHRMEFDRAKYCYFVAMTICTLRDDAEGLAMNAINIGTLAGDWSDVTAAEGWYRKALEMGEAAGLKNVVATAQTRLAKLYRGRGQYDDAERALGAAGAIADELHDVRLRAHVMRDLGNLSLQRGDLDRAEQLHEQVLALERRLQRQPRIAAQYHNLATVAQRKGDLSTAEVLYLQAMQVNESMGNRGGLALQHSGLALLYANRGELDRALTEIEAARALYEEVHDNSGLGQAFLNLGHIQELRGEYDLARQSFLTAASLLDLHGEPAHQAKAWLRAGRAAVLTGASVQEVHHALRNAYHRAKVADDPDLLGEALLALGHLFEAAEKFDDSKTLYEASRETFRKISSPRADEVALEIDRVASKKKCSPADTSR